MAIRVSTAIKGQDGNPLKPAQGGVPPFREHVVYKIEGCPSIQGTSAGYDLPALTILTVFGGFDLQKLVGNVQEEGMKLNREEEKREKVERARVFEWCNGLSRRSYERRVAGPPPLLLHARSPPQRRVVRRRLPLHFATRQIPAHVSPPASKCPRSSAFRYCGRSESQILYND